MTDTIRKKVFDKVAAGLANIRTENGYETDIGEHVFEAVDPGQSVPAVNVIPQVSQIARQQYGDDYYNFPIRFECVDYFDDRVSGKDRVSKSEAMIGDIVKCIFAITWTGDDDPTVDDIQATECGTESFPEPRDDFVGAYVLISFHFATAAGDPYNQ